MYAQTLNTEFDDNEAHAVLVKRFFNPLPEFTLLSPADEGRQKVEQYVRARYLAAYAADAVHFLPWLLSMQCMGQTSGVAGLQPAAATRLFLEQYLAVPIEATISKQMGTAVKRDVIVEVGNLVAARKGASHLLFLLFTAVLHSAGYEWMVFTATHALRNNLHKLGLSLVELKRIDPSELPESVKAQWGSYYATEPVVMGLRLAEADILIKSRSLYRRFARAYAEPVRVFAGRLTRNQPHAA